MKSTSLLTLLFLAYTALSKSVSSHDRTVIRGGNSRRRLVDESNWAVTQLRGGATSNAATFLNAIDLFGTSVFAFSGAVTAGEKGMDLIGMCVLATVTSVGGGTIRDALLGATPVFWMQQPVYLQICVATAITTYFVWPTLEKKGFQGSSKLICVSDALGLSAFAVIGTQKAANMNLNPLIWIVSGLMTATFGGITRDVICQEPPRSLYPHRSMYALHPLIGSAVYALLRSRLGVPTDTAAMISFTTTLICRILSFDRALRLPHWKVV